MTFDPIYHLGAVTRRVEGRQWQDKPARVVVAERSYDTDAADLWDALTDAGRLPRWFMPISGELRLGGRYQLEGNAGGTITDCEPPRRLGVTWEFGGGMSWVFVTLTPEGDDRTRLQLEHIAHEDEQYMGFYQQFGPGAVGVGWDLSIMGLAEHIASGGSAKPRDEAAWLTEGEGKPFALGSAEAWGAAAIAFGDETEAARKAAAATAAFYTGGGEGQGAEQRD